MSSIATTVSTPVTKTTKSKTTPSAPKKSKKNESVVAPQELDDVKVKIDFGSDNENTTQTVQTVEEVKPEPKKRGRKSNVEKVAEATTNETSNSDSETAQVVEDKKPEPKKRGRKSNAQKVAEKSDEGNTSADSSTEETNDNGLKTIDEVKFTLNIIQLKVKSIQEFMIKGNKRSKTNYQPNLILHIISNGVDGLYEYIQSHLSSASATEAQIEEINSNDDVKLSISVMLEKVTLINKFISKSAPKVHRPQLRLMVQITVDGIHLFEEYLNTPTEKNVKKQKTEKKERNLPRLELNPIFLDFLKTYENTDSEGNVSNTLIENVISKAKNNKFAQSYATRDPENPYLLKQTEVQNIVSRIFQDMKDKNNTKTKSFPIQNDSHATSLVNIYNQIIDEEVKKGDLSFFKDNITKLRSTVDSKGKSCEPKLNENNEIPDVISNNWLTCYNPFLFVRKSLPKTTKTDSSSEVDSDEDDE